MKTVTLKLSEELENELKIIAQDKGITKSSVIREALVEYLASADRKTGKTFTGLAADLAGSLNGPVDLSTSKKYMQDYGK